MLDTLTPERKQKIRDSQADKKGLGLWVKGRVLPDTMTKMEVQDVLNSLIAVVMRDIIVREGPWRVKFQDDEGSEFFTKMVDGKVKFKGTEAVPRTSGPWPRGL